VAITIESLVMKRPDLLKSAPHFTPIDRVDEVGANRNPTLSESLKTLPALHPNRLPPLELLSRHPSEIAGWLAET
jgi:glycine dehydrogenase